MVEDGEPHVESASGGEVGCVASASGTLKQGGQASSWHTRLEEQRPMAGVSPDAVSEYVQNGAMQLQRHLVPRERRRLH